MKLNYTTVAFFHIFALSCLDLCYQFPTTPHFRRNPGKAADLKNTD